MNIVLMGTNDFVVPMFDAVAKDHNILAVFTRGPKPVGRKQILTKSPVHVWAESRGLPVYHKTAEYNFKPDMVVVVSYGAILRDNVLNSAPCINIHPSSLPLYRGPSPIRTAIYNGDATSAVCLMQVTPELDAGAVYMRRAFDIGENDTNEMVEQRVSEIGTQMLTAYLSAPEKYVSTPQVGEPTFTRKFTGDDEIIDWTRSPRDIHNQIRALGAGRTKINGMDVKVLETRIINNELKITRLQPAGKKPMDWKSFVNGLRGAEIKIGE